jgi:putative hydrolase of HD superfamily
MSRPSMEIKADNPITLFDRTQMPVIIQVYLEFNHLKQLFRQGWLRHGIPRDRCESVAEHSLGVAVLALLLAETYHPELDTNKVLRMALLHDFGEIYAGDIIPNDENSTSKSRLERESMLKVFEKLPNGKNYVSLWEDFESGDSREAHFVRQVDRLEMGLQAAVYQARGYTGLGEILESARRGLVDEELNALLESLEVLI